MKRTLKVMMVGGLLAAGFLLPATPAHAATCVGYMDRHDEQHAGVWDCDPCPRALYGPLDGEFQVVVCLRNN